MANMNFTKEEDELIALIEDAVIAGKNKMDIIDNLDDKFADVKATRFDYLYSIAKCRAMYKKTNYKDTSKSFADHNKSKKEAAIKLSQQGKSIPQIAKELELEVHTIEYYLDNSKEIKNKQNTTKRQQVLDMLKSGISKHEISQKLGISIHSIDCYISKFRKEGKLPPSNRVKSIPQDNYSDEIIPFDELIKPVTSDFKADEIQVDKSIVKNAKCVCEGDKVENINNIKPVDVKAFKERVNSKNNITTGKELSEKMKNSLQKSIQQQVKHPNYYNTEHYECWTVWGEIVKAYNIPPVQAALLFNVLKYIWRYSAKGTPIQDLNKAANYIEELIKEVQE